MIKFTVFGNLHFDEVADGENRINQLIQHIKIGKPDFIISLGDLCRPIEENKKKILDKFASIGIPMYHTIGNHETDSCVLDSALQFLSMKNAYYSFEIDGIKYIVLNSCYSNSRNGR